MSTQKTIVIDARTIDSSTGHYTQHLLFYLNKLFADEFAFVVLVPSKSLPRWREQYPRLTVAPANEQSYSIAEQTSLISRLQSYSPDLVHFTMPQQPFLWVKPAVTTIHDLTLVRYDNVDMNRLVYKMKKGVFISLLHSVMARAKAVITPTEYVKNDLVSYMGKRYRSKIHVTLEAGEILESSAQKIGQLSDKKFLLFVGNAFPYKNVRLIIDAFARLQTQQPELHLALAGKKDFFYEELENYVKKNGITNVHFLGFISDGEKRWALQHCVSYVTSSLSEGFNIPTLEAMSEGAPLIASRASCHPEVIGDAALYFDPHSVDDLADQIKVVLEESSVRDALIKKGNARVKQFSWQRMAEQTVEIYRQALLEK